MYLISAFIRYNGCLLRKVKYWYSSDRVIKKQPCLAISIDVGRFRILEGGKVYNIGVGVRGPKFPAGT